MLVLFFFLWITDEEDCLEATPPQKKKTKMTGWKMYPWMYFLLKIGRFLQPVMECTFFLSTGKTPLSIQDCDAEAKCVPDWESVGAMWVDVTWYWRGWLLFCMLCRFRMVRRGWWLILLKPGDSGRVVKLWLWSRDDKYVEVGSYWCVLLSWWFRSIFHVDTKKGQVFQE